MGFTARQLEIVEILKSGIAFLESQPKKEKYSLRDIFTACGDDIHSSNLYALIKQLKKKRATMELSELRQIFARLNVEVKPLDEPLDDLLVEENDSNELILEAHSGLSVTDKPKATAVEAEVYVKPSQSNSGPLESVIPFKDFEPEINSLTLVLRTLAPMTRDMRMNLLEAVESFYGIGR
jgi:hypothetical protein